MYIQSYNNKENVLSATKRRIKFIFDNFENINVSISGGKDSTVLAHLTLKEASKRNRKIGLFFLDEEVVYQSTIEQIQYLMNLFSNNIISKLWLQLEFNLTNATSLMEGQLKCWEKGKSKQWMRSKESFSIHYRTWDKNKETIQDKNKGFGFHDVIENFEKGYTNTGFLLGLRAAGEALTRRLVVTKNPVMLNNKKIFWATKRNKNILLHPIYDWNFHDIWKYIYENNIKYSKVYDWQFKKGFPINEMRLSSLIHEKSFKSLCDLPEFEPKTYDKLCKRIKGISFAQETGKNSKMFKVRKLPKNFNSWIKYKEFLLKTYPDKNKINIFLKRFSKHLTNEFVARQQCRQLILNDYENNLPVKNKPDPREELIKYYAEVL